MLKICQKKNLTQYFVLSVDTEEFIRVANEQYFYIVIIIGKDYRQKPEYRRKNWCCGIKLSCDWRADDAIEIVYFRYRPLQDLAGFLKQNWIVGH